MMFVKKFRDFNVFIQIFNPFIDIDATVENIAEASSKVGSKQQHQRQGHPHDPKDQGQYFNCLEAYFPKDFHLTTYRQFPHKR